MKCAKILMGFTLISMVVCEPPVPSSQYLPSKYSVPKSPSFPSESYGVPNPLAGSYSAPSANYGVPVSRESNSNGYVNGITDAVIVDSADYTGKQEEFSPNGNYNGNGNGNNQNGNYGYEEQEPANYHFEYMVKDEPSGNDFGHQETRQGVKTFGKYYVVLPDGRKQIVEYEADENGYRPKISYEEGYPIYNGLNGVGYEANGYSPKGEFSQNIQEAYGQNGSPQNSFQNSENNGYVANGGYIYKK